MKKIIGIAAAALMSLSLFACSTTTKTTRTIDDVPYSNTRIVRKVETKRKAPRVLTPKTVKTRRVVDAPNLLPYVMLEKDQNYRNTTYKNNYKNRTVETPYNVNN